MFIKKVSSSVVSGVKKLTGAESDDRLKQIMTDIFDTLDVNGDGTITQDEIITFFRGDEKAIAEVKNLLSQGDSNNDQEYSREEFQQIIVNWKKKGLLKVKKDFLKVKKAQLKVKMVQLMGKTVHLKDRKDQFQIQMETHYQVMKEQVELQRRKYPQLEKR